MKTIDKKSIALIGIVILSSTASFGLGRLSVAQDKIVANEVQIIVPELKSMSDIDTSQFAFVASKSGTRYYPKDCKSAERIKDENKVYFMTEEEAQDTGLTRAAGCNF